MMKQNTIMVVLCIALVSFLMAANVSKIDKDTSIDKTAHDYSVAATTLGFVGLGVIAGSVIESKYYLLMLLSIVSAGLVGLTFYVYDRLNKSTSENNGNERKLALASFCFALIALSFGFSHFLIHHSEKMSSGKKVGKK